MRVVQYLLVLFTIVSIVATITTPQIQAETFRISQVDAGSIPAELQLPVARTDEYEMINPQQFAIEHNPPSNPVRVAPDPAATRPARQIVPAGGNAEMTTYINTHVNERWQLWFKNIIWCESRWNPHAKSYANTKGILQFLDTTFRANGGKNIWDWREQIDVAQRMVDKNPNNIYQWSCSGIMGY